MNLTMKKIGVLVLAAGLFCGISSYANAKGDRSNGASHYMEQLPAEQQNQARAIFEEAKKAGQGLREEIASKRAELAEVMKSANPDSARIEALSKELGQLRGKEMLARMYIAQKLKEAGLPEMKKPARDGRAANGAKGDRQAFADKRIAQLPEAKQAEAKRLFDEYQTATAQMRVTLKANRALLDKALEAGDAAVVTNLSTEMGELKGKMLVAKAELRQNLAKADIPVDTFDRADKKVSKRGKDGKREKDGKRGEDGRHGKDGKRDKKMD